MSTVGIVLSVTAALLVGAYCLNLIVEVAKVIYKLAPIVVPLVVMVGLLIYAAGGWDTIEKEIKAQDANYIESIEDQSNGGRY